MNITHIKNIDSFHNTETTKTSFPDSIIIDEDNGFVGETEDDIRLKNDRSFQNTEINFHGITIIASVNELIEAVGYIDFQSKNNGQDEINFKWNCDFEDYNVFTIYDWKEYRTISEDEQIEWHIGGYSKVQTDTIANMLELLLNKSRLNKL